MVSGCWLHGVEVVPRWCFRWCFSGLLIEGVDGVCRWYSVSWSYLGGVVLVVSARLCRCLARRLNFEWVLGLRGL